MLQTMRGDHAEGLRNMNSCLEIVEQIHNSVEEEIKEGEDREKLFAQRRALFEQECEYSYKVTESKRLTELSFRLCSMM